MALWFVNSTTIGVKDPPAVGDGVRDPAAAGGGIRDPAGNSMKDPSNCWR